MSRARFGAVAFVCLATVAVTAGGCATEAAEEEQADTSSAIQRCDPYPVNPACSAPLFLQTAWERGVKDAWNDAILPAASILGCFSALRGAGLILEGTRVVAPRLLAGAAARVIGRIAEFEGCHQTALYLDRIGLTANISCMIEPRVYDADVHICMCRNECSGTPKPLAYLDRMNNCHCTKDAHEAACGIVGCSVWVTDDRSDPNYCACSR
jgi:hypothetical protein